MTSYQCSPQQTGIRSCCSVASLTL